MKNILKIALVVIVSTCNADMPPGIHDYRAHFENNITTKMLEATKSPEVKKIIDSVNNAKLTGFVLHDIHVHNGPSSSDFADVLVSLHDNKPASYHILFENSALLDFSRQNTPQAGYYLLTDELKNKINASTQKSDYAVSPLRKEMLQESFKQPGVNFDHVKFLKENQVTKEKINQNAIETLDQVNQATKMKQDTYKFATNLFKTFIKDQSQIANVNSIFDDFITKMTDIANPKTGFDFNKVNAALNKFNHDHSINFDDPIYNALDNCKVILVEYANANSSVSLPCFEDKCKLKAFSSLGYINDINMKPMITSISNHINNILSHMSNSAQVNNKDYDTKKIKDEIKAIRVEIEKITDVSIKTKISHLMNGYESSIAEFDFSDEIGNAIYLDTMYFNLDSQDLENKMKVLDLSRQNKMVSKLFKHDLVFPTSYSTSAVYDMKFVFLGESDKRNHNIFNMFLYNSTLNNYIKISLLHYFKAITDFFNKDGGFILTEQWKNILSKSTVHTDELNKLTNQDYLNLYNSLFIFSDKQRMDQLTTLERFLNVPNQEQKQIPIRIITQP